MQNKRIIEELRRIESKNGILRAEDVVKNAAVRTSPLHPEFEWDDTKAAHQHRLDQARALIRVCVEFVGEEKKPRQVFVSLKSDRIAGGGYRSTVSVLRMNDLRAQLVEDALQDMETFQSRYSRITELAGVREQMSIAADKLKGKVARKRKAS